MTDKSTTEAEKRYMSVSVGVCMLLISVGAGLQFGVGAGLMALGVMFFFAILLQILLTLKS